MRGWTRRRLLAAGAAAACVGCAEFDDDAGVTAGTAVPVTGAPPTLPAFDAFGVSVPVGPLDEVSARLDSEGAIYVAEARTWITRVPAEIDDAALAAYDETLHEGLRAGLVGLFEKCPHLGCRVPHCSSSGWFECPCHATRFDTIGEHRSGPSPRGLDHHAVRIVDGAVSIDTSRRVPGVALGTSTIGDAPAGPHCVAADDE